MPPKPQKKGDLEDYSDVVTLPKVKVFKFALVFKQFFVKENRDKVQKIVQNGLVQMSAHKVKLLTREEIVTYGTGKGYIMTHDAIKLLPEDDPRKLLTDEDMIARSAADKLFELTVAVRRDRKDKVAKIEAEIAALTAQGKDTSHLSLESDNADVMFQFIDYPVTKKEALALSKFGHSLNCVFEIEEVRASADRDEQDAHKHTYFSIEPPKQGPLDDGDEANKAKNVGLGFREAKFVCSAKSSLRQLALIKVPFMDRKEIIQSKDKDGEIQEKVRTPEESFLGQLYSKFIDKYSQYYFQYLKFKSRVSLEPLMPDPTIMAQMRKLEQEGIEIQQFIEETAAHIDEGMSAMERTKSEVTQEEAARLQKEFDSAKTGLLKQREDLKEQHKQRQQELKALRSSLKVSLDDERDYSKFKIDAYKKDFIANPETANNISSVLSAMVTQIEENSQRPWENTKSQQLKVSQGDDETMADSLDDLFEQFNFDITCDLKFQDRGPDPKKEVTLADTLSSKYNFGGRIQIHEESDRTKEITQTLPLKLVEKEGERAALIQERQQEVLKNLNLPGKDRHLMPAIPATSKRIRDSENPSFYPFCTLPIADAERMLLLKQMQQLVKSNFIDQDASATMRNPKYKVFERSFENYMEPQIFRQVFNDALLDKPEMATLYYPRTDSLLVTLFNRVSKKEASQPTESAVDMPEFFLGEQLDGEQKWQAQYRVMPDFQNWLAFFAEEVLLGQEIVIAPESEEKAEPVKEAPKGGKAPAKGQEKEEETGQPMTVSFMKYSIDDEMLPDSMLNIDDDIIQSIQENSASLYPDDNSIMRVDHFTVGGSFFSKSIVQKDNLKFGLRHREPQEEVVEQDDNSVDEDDTENGLVSYKQIGDSEFWLHFENGTKLAVEQVQVKRNPQKTIRIDPPVPTAEEIAAKEDAIKAYQAAVTKAQQKKQPIPQLDDFNIPKTPQPRWETKPLNYLDTLFTEEILDKPQSMATITLRNGLILEYLGSGHVMQIHEKEAIRQEERAGAEINRIVSKDGVVIRQFRNHDAEVLFADGVRAQFSKKRMEWTLTNNLGKRRRFRNGIYSDMEEVPTAVETDQETGAKMMIREDGVLSVTYADGSVYCHHQDGTKIHTTADQSEIRIEKKNYASHTIKIGKAAQQTDHQSEMHRNAFQRALDDTVLETYLPDGSMTQTFLDCVISSKGEEQERYRHMIKRSDLSIVVVDSAGHVSTITSNARAALNEAGRKMRLSSDERDIDYLVELSRKPHNYTPGVYQAHVSSKEGKSWIRTKNTLDSIVFELTCDHTLSKYEDAGVCKTPPMNVRRKGTNITSPRSQSPKVLGELELEETGIWEDPFQKYYKYPRFFVVQSNGHAKELLSQNQLEYAIRTKRIQTDQSIKQKMRDVVNNVGLANHYFLTKVINMNQIEIETQKLNDLDLPQNAAKILEKRNQMPEVSLQIPVQDQYLYQQIFQMPPCDLFSQQAFANDYLRQKEWQMQQVRYNSEFAIQFKIGGKDGVDPKALEDDWFYNKRINKNILKHRAQPRQEFQPEEFKNQAMKEMVSSGDVQAFRVASSMNRSLNSVTGSVRGASRDYQREGSRGVQEAKIRSNLQGEALRKSNDSAQSILEDNHEVDYHPRTNAKHVHQLFEEITQKRREKKEIPPFISKYFESQQAQPFCKNNPLTRPSEEVWRRMQQRIERSKQPDAGSNQKGSYRQGSTAGDALDDKNNPIVALEPDELKQGSNFLGSKKGQSTSIGPGEKSTEKDGNVDASGPLPSLYLQEKIYLYNKDQETLLKAEEHHIVKTKDFNVYGRLRDEKPFVKSIAKSKAQTELNEKFITTECITDRRVKVSSMAPRFYMNAPSVEDVRKQGQHQMILSAINKKQTFAELINQANSMVTGVLHDSLKRSLNLMPSFVDFGAVRVGSVNEIILTVKNEDSIGQRITVKPVKDNRIVVQQQEYGMIAPGMIKKISILIRVSEEEPSPGSIKETIKILSKHDVFNIPVSASILSMEAFDDQNQQKLAQTGKPIQNSRVRERLNRAMVESRGSERSNPQILTKKPRDKSRDEDSIGAASMDRSKSNQYQSKSLHSNK